MSKVLTDKEMADIVRRAVDDDSLIECEDSYLHFLEDLAQLIASHFGGEAGTATTMGVAHDDPNGHDGIMYTVAFQVNESVPPDGGVYRDYDKDVTWEDGREVA